MPKRIFDFKCEKNHVTEQYVDSETRTISCSKCQGQAKRIISPVSCSLDPVSGEFPGATMKWARDHEKAANKN